MKSRSHSNTDSQRLPNWVPGPAVHYLAHTETGIPIRELARRADVHASTILRQIRRFESRRDDPLVDGALRRLSGCVTFTSNGEPQMRVTGKTAQGRRERDDRETGVMNDLRRVLRRLTETGAFLAVARDMEMSVVMREAPDGQGQRTATVPRDVAQALALKEWISSDDPEKRVARYHITAAGRAALKEMFPAGGDPAPLGPGFAEAPARFEVAEDPLLHHMRNSLAESPLSGLARRRDKTGQPFLSRDLVAAGERLREDYELAGLIPGGGVDWLAFLADDDAPAPAAPDDVSAVAWQAQCRVAEALRGLGCGLGEVALRVCCHLEGMESLEKRMGWSARSGKIVLRIALTQLVRHYAASEGPHGPMIG